MLIRFEEVQVYYILVFEKISWSIDVCDYVIFNLNIYLFKKNVNQLETITIYNTCL